MAGNAYCVGREVVNVYPGMDVLFDLRGCFDYNRMWVRASVLTLSTP